jgi:hypothetical protein
LACLRGFRGGGGPAGGLDFRPVSAHFSWDWAKEATCWPDLPHCRGTPAEVTALSIESSTEQGTVAAHLLVVRSECEPEAVESAAVMR